MSNAVFSASGYGTRVITVTEVAHGMRIIQQEGHARTSKVLYVKVQTSGSFNVQMVFRDYADFVGTMRWFEGYGKRLISGAPTGPMRVMVPSRQFDKVGIPESGIPMGDRVGNLTYPTAINFMGATDVVSTYSTFHLEEARQPHNDPHSPYYYPGGIQLSGGASAPDSLLYDHTTNPQDVFDSISDLLKGL